MTVIVCVDDRMGQAFHNRRLSRDRALNSRITGFGEGTTLSMSPYSRTLFGEEGAIQFTPDYLERADKGSVCFVELEDIRPYLDKVDRIVLYRWNRTYPYELRFPDVVNQPEWRLVSTTEFPGHSHPVITEEIYEKA